MPLKRILTVVSLAVFALTLPMRASDLNAEILSRENQVWKTFLGDHPDTDAFQKMILPDYFCIEPTGVLLTKEENIAVLKTLTFSS